MTKKLAQSIADEAIRITREFPELTWNQAIEAAKEMYERKEPTADQSK